MVLVENKKARFNFELAHSYEAGVELAGFEVKSLRQKQGSMEGAYAMVRGGEVFLTGMHIPPYQPKNAPTEYESRRTRKLLLTKKEIAELEQAEKKKGLTLIPVSVYTKGRKIKVELALARGKKKYDKRETLKCRTALREMNRSLKYE
jgi:SsrA-binding protein